MGEWLARKDPLHTQALKSYVSMKFNGVFYNGMGIEEAIRIYLSEIRLPGEGQQVERLMDEFAAAYFPVAPIGFYENPDAVCTLAYAIIMVNTDLHNQNNKRKMTEDQFVSMTRDINNGKSFQRDFLTNIFNSVKRTEFKMQKGDYT